MKIRQGFVSNSSSTSFVYDVCKEEFCGMDLCASDVEHKTCINGHIFCNDRQVRELTDEEEQEYDYNGETPSEVCPICQMQTVSSSDISKYVFKLTGKTKEVLAQEIKDKFPTYNDFMEFLRK